MKKCGRPLPPAHATMPFWITGVDVDSAGGAISWIVLSEEMKAPCTSA
jgi:hypothetical protein